MPGFPVPQPPPSPPVPQTSASTGGKPFAPSSLHGWADLRNTINSTVVASLRNATRYRTMAQTALRHAGARVG